MFIDENGKKWFKGNLHTHTTRSDGRRSPEDVIALYRENGYDFLALTDHWKYAPSYMTEDGLLLLSGLEYNINGADILKGVFHILGIGMKEDPMISREGGDPAGQDIVDTIHAHGGVAILAHPAWSMDTCDQVMSIHGYDATEIYNSVSGLPHNCRPYSGEVIDQCAARGCVIPCIADDDTHFYDGEQCLSYIWVQADELTDDAIVEAIRAGRFFATQGPKFSLSTRREDNGDIMVKVNCTPVRSVVFYTGSVWCGGRSVCGEAVTEAEFRMRAQDRFVRVELIDENGMHAWATPILYDR
ncbi:MAG: CehA/McbA family metallohydrolase [Clostridia bacterium]|nr:CehA/McbA family metallohydrolase [Clostridia bacterium]